MHAWCAPGWWCGPAGGSLYVFNRAATRNFRQDGVPLIMRADRITSVSTRHLVAVHCVCWHAPLIRCCGTGQGEQHAVEGSGQACHQLCLRQLPPRLAP